MDFKTKRFFGALLNGLNNTFVAANERISEVIPVIDHPLYLDQALVGEMASIENLDMLNLVEHGGDKELYDLVAAIVTRVAKPAKREQLVEGAQPLRELNTFDVFKNLFAYKRERGFLGRTKYGWVTYDGKVHKRVTEFANTYDTTDPNGCIVKDDFESTWNVRGYIVKVNDGIFLGDQFGFVEETITATPGYVQVYPSNIPDAFIIPEHFFSNMDSLIRRYWGASLTTDLEIFKQYPLRLRVDLEQALLNGIVELEKKIPKNADGKVLYTCVETALTENHKLEYRSEDGLYVFDNNVSGVRLPERLFNTDYPYSVKVDKYGLLELVKLIEGVKELSAKLTQ